MGNAVQDFTTSPPLVRLVATSFVCHLFKTLLEKIFVKLTVRLETRHMAFVSQCTPTQLCLGLNEN